MTLDPKRLARDAKRVQATRLAGGLGRETTGVTRAVRDGLPMIHQLRKSGITWAAIAAAMSAQGVTQGAGKPLTESPRDFRRLQLLRDWSHDEAYPTLFP